MRRRIAVITARADASEQRDILYGIFEAAFREDTDVVVYSNIYNHWQDDNLLNYENIIYSLIEPDLFDGVIVTAEAFRDIKIINDTIDKIRAAKIPAIVIDGELDGFKSVYSDDETDMENDGTSDNGSRFHRHRHTDGKQGQCRFAKASERLQARIRKARNKL